MFPTFLESFFDYSMTVQDSPKIIQQYRNGTPCGGSI